MTPTPRTAKTTTVTTEESPSAAASRYQQLRSHLAELKLPAAAEALPAVLDQASAEGLSLTVALERLLAVEVEASTAPAVGRAAAVRLPAHPSHPGRLRRRRRRRHRPQADRGAGHLPLPRIGDQHLVDRPTRHRENPPQRRTGTGRRACRLQDLLHHRRGPGRPLPPRRYRGTLGDHHALLRRPHPAGDRRTRVSTAARRGRLSAVSGCLPTRLKTSI